MRPLLLVALFLAAFAIAPSAAATDGGTAGSSTTGTGGNGTGGEETGPPQVTGSATPDPTACSASPATPGSATFAIGLAAALGALAARPRRRLG